MKKYLLFCLAAMMLSFTFPSTNVSGNLKNAKSTAKTKRTPVLRFYGLDQSGDYTVYVYAEPTYVGSICCGNASITIVNNSTSASFTAFGLAGVIEDTTPSVSGHARIYEDGLNKQIFFDLF